MTAPQPGKRRPVQRPADRPRHPKVAAAVLMIGIVVALVIISIATLP